MTDNELNALVAEKAMGFSKLRYVYPSPYPNNDGILLGAIDGQEKPIPNYANDIAAAWSVVDKMESLYYECEVYQGSAFCERQAKFWKSDNQGDLLSYVTSESLPRAICLAALEAVGVEVE